MKHMTVTISIFLLLLMSALVVTGCGNPVEDEPPVDPFTTTWNLGEDGRSFSISGNTAGHRPGEISEFQLIINNLKGGDTWQFEYCIVLVDTEGIVKEIIREDFSVPSGLETQKTIRAQFPGDMEGPLGLCVVFPGRASSITTVWVGEKTGVAAGPWPNIVTCPYYLTEAGSQELAGKFVLNSPTFLFDGDLASLELQETLYPDIENAWQFVFSFESAHAGYGDRTGQMLAQVITPHEVVVTVEQGVIVSAIMDNAWNMLEQEEYPEMVISPAPIHEVEVVFMESYPVQVGVRIQMGLSSGCTTFHDAVVTRSGETIHIEVTTQYPRDAVCTAIYTYHEENPNLGSDFTSGVTYTLEVNDYTTTFTMP